MSPMTALPLTPPISPQSNGMAFTGLPAHPQNGHGPLFRCTLPKPRFTQAGIKKVNTARDIAIASAARNAAVVAAPPPFASMVSSNEMIPTSTRRVPQGRITPLSDAAYDHYASITTPTKLPVSYQLEAAPFVDTHYTFIDPESTNKPFENLFNRDDDMVIAAMEGTASLRKRKHQRVLPLADQAARGLLCPDSPSKRLRTLAEKRSFAAKAITYHAHSNATTIGTNQGALTEFTYFGKLPGELQNTIWKLAAADTQSRVVELRHDPLQGFYSNTLSCPLLHVCFNARQAALEHYHPLTIEENFTGVYINWDKDTLFFGPYEKHTKFFPLDSPMAHGIFAEILEKCKHLAVGVDTMYGTHAGFQDWEDNWGFGDFKDLSSVTVVWNINGNVINDHGLLTLTDDHVDGDDYASPVRGGLPHMQPWYHRLHSMLTNCLEALKEKNNKLEVSIKNAYRGDQVGVDEEEKLFNIAETEKKLVEWRKDIEQCKVREAYERYMKRTAQVQEDERMAQELQRQLDRRERI